MQSCVTDESQAHITQLETIKRLLYAPSAYTSILSSMGQHNFCFPVRELSNDNVQLVPFDVSTHLLYINPYPVNQAK